MEKSKSNMRQMALILNLAFLVVIVFAGAFYAGVFYDVVYSDTYLRIVAFSIALVPDLAYAVIGAGFFVVVRAFPVPISNRILPFAAIPLQTIPAVKSVYEPLIGSVSDQTAAALGLAASAILFTWGLLAALKVAKTPADI